MATHLQTEGNTQACWSSKGGTTTILRVTSPQVKKRGRPIASKQQYSIFKGKRGVMARRLISKAGDSAITTTEPTPPLPIFHWSNPTSMSNIQPSCSYQRRPAKHSIQQTYSASTCGSTLQDGYHPAHDQCTIMEKQTSLTVTQDMDGGSPDHETSAEKQ